MSDLQQSYKDVQAHYDLSDDFFKLEPDLAGLGSVCKSAHLDHQAQLRRLIGGNHRLVF